MNQVKLSNSQLEQLTSFVEDGPLEAGQTIHSTLVKSLLKLGLIARVVINGEDHWMAATMGGAKAYKDAYGTTLGGEADTIAEAKANRIMLQLLNDKNVPK